MINDKLSTMYSSGSPEGQPDTSKFIIIYVHTYIFTRLINSIFNVVQIKLEFLTNHLLMVNIQSN